MSELRALRRNLARSFAVAWFAGLGLLLAISLWEGLTRRADELDKTLAVRATVIYGLAYFDESGALRTELLEREPLAQDDAYPMRVFLDASARDAAYGPAVSPALAADLQGHVAAIMASERETWSGDAAGQRVHLLPMYFDDGLEPAGVACVAHPLSSLRSQQLHFAALLVGTFALLAGAGILVAIRLANRSVAPVAAVLADRERFIAGAAHELRTPLATLSALAASGLAGDEPANAALERIAGVLTDTERTVEALLAYARLESGSHEPRYEATRIDLLVERLTETMPGATLDLAEVTAEVDLPLFELAASNLLNNAVAHGRASDGAGATVTVRGSSLSVQDSGPGFPATLLDRAGRHYGWTTSPTGHGIGLALVHRVAELHGGTLRLENTASGACAVLTWR